MKKYNYELVRIEETNCIKAPYVETVISYYEKYSDAVKDKNIFNKTLMRKDKPRIYIVRAKST